MFKIVINDPAGEADKQKQVLEKIKFYKNTRSHLEEIIYRPIVDGKGVLYTGVKIAYQKIKIVVEVRMYGMG